MYVFILIAAEQELVKLQQQYRILEGDRKSYSDESQNKIRKQRAAIEALQNENEELVKENKLAGSQLNKTKVLFLYLAICHCLKEAKNLNGWDFRNQ